MAQAARIATAALAAAVGALPVTGVAAGAEWTVHAYTSAFQPDTLTVAVGDTVTWVNETPAKHLLMFDTDPAGGGAGFQQGLAREPYSMTVRVPGRYLYRCAIHGMYAELVVTPARHEGR